MRQPTFFIPHGGGPCFFMNPDYTSPPMWRQMRDFLAGLIRDLPEKPRAILLISGHWIEPTFTVHTGKQPDLLFDYYNFPPHTYQLRWDAPGAPDVAIRAAQLLEAAGIPTATESERGWDHGVFIPMKVALPDADIPLAQISLANPHPRADYDASLHVAAGRALAPLRDEGVLIVGSGMSFHNLALLRTSADFSAYADAFEQGLTAIVTDPDPTRREEGLARWNELDAARVAHPPHGGEEHLIPLMVAAGAGDNDAAQRIFVDDVLGWKVAGYRFG